MLYELVTLTTKLGRTKELLALIKNEAAPVGGTAGLKTVAWWTGEEKPDEVTWLRTYPHAARRDEIRMALQGSKEWQQVGKGIGQSVSWISELPLEPGFSPLAVDNPKTVMVNAADLRMYYFNPGGRVVYMHIIKDYVVGLGAKYGLTVLGAWYPLDMPNVVVWMWGYPMGRDRHDPHKAYLESAERKTWAHEMDGIINFTLNRFIVPAGTAP